MHHQGFRTNRIRALQLDSQPEFTGLLESASRTRFGSQVEEKAYSVQLANFFWIVMFLSILGQQGGIVGGVGQALSITFPLTDAGKEKNAIVSKRFR